MAPERNFASLGRESSGFPHNIQTWRLSSEGTDEEDAVNAASSEVIRSHRSAVPFDRELAGGCRVAVRYRTSVPPITCPIGLDRRDSPVSAVYFFVVNIAQTSGPEW